jgi:dienelactone hydrolase
MNEIQHYPLAAPRRPSRRRPSRSRARAACCKAPAARAAEPRGAVLVIHENRGLNDHIRGRANHAFFNTPA